MVPTYVQNSALETVLCKNQLQLRNTDPDTLYEHLVDALHVDGGKVNDFMLLPFVCFTTNTLPTTKLALVVVITPINAFGGANIVWCSLKNVYA
jgi:hypothetical protein